VRTTANCTAVTRKGAPCRRPARDNGFCDMHAPEVPAPQAAEAPESAALAEISSPPASPQRTYASTTDWIPGLLRFLFWAAMVVMAGKAFFAVAAFGVAMLIAVTG